MAEDRSSTKKPMAIAGVLCAIIGVGAIAMVVFDNADSPSGQQRPVGKLVSESFPDGAANSGTIHSTTTATPKPSWPAAVEGRPSALGAQGEMPPTDEAAVAELADGFYLWQDFKGWHLWLVGGSEQDQATVEVDGEFARTSAVGDNPLLSIEPSKAVCGRGQASDHIVGMDFNPGFYTKSITVNVEGNLEIFLGSTSVPSGPRISLVYGTPTN